MKLTASEQIALPIDLVWNEVTDIARFEASLEKRDVALNRDGGDDLSVGTTWIVQVPLAGRVLTIDSRIVRLERPRLIRVEGNGKGMEGYLQARLSAVDKETTRFDLDVELSARSIAAKVAMQPLRLSHGKLQTRLDAQVARAGRGMERRSSDARAADGSAS